MPATAILGDIHGDYDRMIELVGGLELDVHLVVGGDYCDRWSGAVEVIEWLMARPNTTALVGNHAALILGVVEETRHGREGRNTENWLWNGGKTEDLARLIEAPDVIEWLRARPALALVGGTLAPPR